MPEAAKPEALTIQYTQTDEAPALATRSLLPILRAFTSSSGLAFEIADLSLAGRILAACGDRLPPGQRVDDALAGLATLVTRPDANIIKLPNISASIPQLCEAIQELQSAGYAVPQYPVDVRNQDDADVRAAYAKVLGSAVNPVLREGNSDRRVAEPVKRTAQRHPHSMGAWSPDSRTRVVHMTGGDFYDNEQSVALETDDVLRIEHVDGAGHVTVLKSGIAATAGDVFDATKLDVARLRGFLAESIDAAKAENALLSLHLKATMMKVSDPILFGHVVREFFADVFGQHGEVLAAAGAEPNQGLGQVLSVIAGLPASVRALVESSMAQVWVRRPDLAMVDSDRGITNLHVPSDVIIDASMPAAIRAGGKMYGPDGRLRDTHAIIPDRCYAGIYQAVIDDCKANGAFDVATMGSVSNVGLMAKKAEEYGSHDKTFEVAADGVIRVVGQSTGILMQHDVQKGDVWRACQTKHVAIVDWVKLGVGRARATGDPAVFWLDEHRAHDRQLIQIVGECLKQHDTSGLDIKVLSPIDATVDACGRARRGLNTISVTGNVLRDYLTDLFPILELGTSAKMLSIVPLLAGGGMFETGAGGSAPKHVEQFMSEGHLRWDSLGEFLAVAVSLEELAAKTGDAALGVLAATLTQATDQFLEQNKSPSRDVGELDNRGSHFYLSLFWAEALASQTTHERLRTEFTRIAAELRRSESVILDELRAAQGSPVDLGGYYMPDPVKADAAMRPSETFNAIIDSIGVASPASAM